MIIQFNFDFQNCLNPRKFTFAREQKDQSLYWMDFPISRTMEQWIAHTGCALAIAMESAKLAL